MVVGGALGSVALVGLINHLADLPVEFNDGPQWDLAVFVSIPALDTGLTLGLLTVYATIVVAIALTQGIPGAAGSAEAVDVARRQHSLSTGTFALGFSAVSTSFVFASGHIFSTEIDDPMSVRIFWGLAVAGIGVAIAFVAAHAEPRLSEKVMVAEDSLPVLELRHRDFHLDALLRWREDFDHPVPWWQVALAIAVYYVFFVVLSTAYLRTMTWFSGGQTETIEFAQNMVTVGLLLGLVGSLPTLAGISSFARWPLAFSRTACTVIVGLFLVGAVLWWIVWPASVVFAWLTVGFVHFLLWPWYLPYYPRSRWVRRLILFTAWPVHILRRYALVSAYSAQKDTITRLRRGIEHSRHD